MANYTYFTNTNNLFEDEVTRVDTYVNNYRSRIPATQSDPATAPYDEHIAEMERQRQAMLERQKKIEQRTLDSSHRSIGLLRETEQIGVQTAEELVRQREQLETTNKSLDKIHTNQKYGQNHLNGIKSVFCGLKNYISGKSKDTPAHSQTSPDTSSTKGRSSVSGLVDTITNYNNDITPEDRFDVHRCARLGGLDRQILADPVPDSQRINKMLDDNLEQMFQHITRLKELGIELGREIDTQNELVDNIQVKVKVADIKIGKNTKAINKLLRKKSSFF